MAHSTAPTPVRRKSAGELSLPTGFDVASLAEFNRLSPELRAFFERQTHAGEVDDLVLETDSGEAVIATVLQRRFAKREMYTSIGPVLIAVNPYQKLTRGDRSLYDPEFALHYYQHASYEVAPHIFRIGAQAYRQLVQEREKQCIVISGESGAGKTEAAKQLMQFITIVSNWVNYQRVKRRNSVYDNAAGGIIDGLKRSLMESNSILEAFGNAQTQRNDNSSRFGKYLTLQLDFKGDIVGAQIKCYLLEKARVVSQVYGERSFHILHHLAAGASEEERRNFLLQTCENYAYLMNETRTIPGVDDAAAWPALKQSFRNMNYAESDIYLFTSLLSAVLAVGNLEVDGAEADDTRRATITSTDALTTCSHLLNIPSDTLATCLTQRTIKRGKSSRRSEYAVLLSAAEVRRTRDTLAKEIYKRLFDWIIQTMNQAMHADEEQLTIGILDIYGFEIFEYNGFEQFCINYVNEKLQQCFISLTLEAEQADYALEGIQWQPISYFDNLGVCTLIDGKPGLLVLMDEVAKFKTADHVALLHAYVRNLSSDEFFISPKSYTRLSAVHAGETFGVRHYAGTVEYHAVNFLEKNADTLWVDLVTAVAHAQNSLLKQLFRDEIDSLNSGVSSRVPESLGKQFKNQVAELMKSIKECPGTHYVRCIKSNDLKRANMFDVDRVNHQINYLGLAENLQVKKAGFCYKQTHKKFLQDYSYICGETWPQFEENTVAIDKLMSTGRLKRWDKSQSEDRPVLGFIKGVDYMIGRRKIFIKAPSTLFQLEHHREADLPYVVRMMQSAVRMFLVRRWYKETLAHVCRIESCVRMFLCMRRYRLARKRVVLMQSLLRRFGKRRVYIRTIAAFVKLQANSRRFVARRKYLFRYAARIQSLVRAYVARRRLPTELQKPLWDTIARVRLIGLRIRSSIMVQSYVRMFVARLSYRRTRSAIKVQSCLRMFVVRRNYKRTLGAIAVQKVVRCFQARKEYLRVQRCVLKAACCIRRHLTRRRLRLLAEEELHNSHQALRRGLTLTKHTLTKRSKSHKTTTYVFRLSAEGDRLLWEGGMFGKGKTGILLTEVTEVTRDPPGHVHGPGRMFSIVTSDRELVLEAADPHQRDALSRYLVHKSRSARCNWPSLASHM